MNALNASTSAITPAGMAKAQSSLGARGKMARDSASEAKACVPMSIKCQRGAVWITALMILNRRGGSQSIFTRDFRNQYF